MSTIDQRVVQMRFDNKQFESGVATTMSTLEKFKQSLNLTGASKGLENVSSAAKNCDMSMLGSAVDTVKSKFSALEVMGITALANITNSAVNAGKRMISALTIDPIKTGFSEYETQINAVQTILANTQSKGTTLDDVNGALDKLNTYADKTIYNFTEMTRNIGTFTAAGVDLDTSVNAIQGIANLAAVSGSTSQQASTAMYQLSQALASGTVKLMDWNSVVNAGMGGQVFQDALKETARIHGVAIDDMIDSEGSFRETLKNGWLTSEILTETLEKFTMTTEGLTEAEIAKNREMLKSKGYTDEQIDAIFKLGETATDAATKVKTFSQLWDTLKEAAQSGWTQTWEIIVGDFEEAKELLTEISNVIGKVIGDSANARNELLQGWKDAGGRTDLIDGLRNAFEGIANIIKPIREAFREIFPPLTVKNLTDFTKGFKDLTARFAEFTASHGPQIKSIFKGIFSVFDIGWTLIKALGGGIASLFGRFSGLGGSVLDVAAAFGDWLTGLRNGIKESDIFGKVIDTVVGFISIAVGCLREGVEYVGKWAGKIRDAAAESDIFGRAIDKVRGFIEKVIEKFKEFGDISFSDVFEADRYSGFLGVMQTIWDIVSRIGSAVGKVFSALGKGLSEAFVGWDFNTIINAINGGLITGILLTIKNFTKGMFDTFNGEGGILENITGILDDVRGCFQAYQDQLKAGTLLKIASAIGILAAAILVISTIDPNTLAMSLGAITVLFGELMGSLAIFTQISGNMKGVTKGVTVMIGVSVAMVILASALKKISSLDLNGIAKGLVAIGVLMAELSIFLRTAKFDSKMIGTATGMVILSSAMLILASATKKFGEMDWGEITKGLVSIGVLLAELALFSNLTGNAKHVISTGIAMVLLGAAMKIMASATKDFATMSWDEIARGLVAMAGALTAVTIAMKLMPKNTLVVGVGLIAVAGAMKILADAMASFGGMSWDEIGRGLAVMGGALLELSLGLNLMNGTLSGSTALIVAAGAMSILATAMSGFGGMTWEEIGQGLVAMGGALLELSIALNLMNGTLAGSAALIVAAGALAILAPAMKSLGEMSLPEIGKALLTMAGAFAVVGIAGALLTPVVPAILGLAAAMALFGVSILGIGAGLSLIGLGLSAISVGFTALAVSLSAGATAIVAALTIIVTGIANLIPNVCIQLANGIIAFAQVIADGAPTIALAIGVLLSEALDLLLTYIPKIVEVGIQLILALLNAIASHIQQVVETAVLIITNFLAGIANSLPKIIQSGIDLMISFINGMADGIRNNTPAVIEATNNLMDAIIGAIKQWFTNALTKGKELVGKLAEGIKAQYTSLKLKGRELVQNLIDGVKLKFSSFKDAAKDMMEGFIAGVKEKFTAIKDAAVNVISGAVDGVKSFLGIKSPSRVFAEIGRWSDEGMVKGLLQYSGIVKNAATDVGEGALDSMSNAMSGLASIFGSEVDSEPVIRPVLDLSNVQNGAGKLDGLFGGQSVALAGIGTGYTRSSLESALSQMQGFSTPNNDDVVSAISELRGDFGDLISAISSMSIRMDSGTVVGELIGKIDSSLGRIASHKGRG